MTHATWSFEQDDLTIVVERSRDVAVVQWRGISDARNPAVFLNATTEAVLPKLKGTKVTVDFRSLEYMNSATVAPLIQFVKTLDAHGLPVLVLFSDTDWQRVHLNCMRSIARTLKHVQVEGRADEPSGPPNAKGRLSGKVA